MTARIFIDGEAGTTGLGIRERLSRLADIDVCSLPAASRKDADAKRELMGGVDLVVLCLPDAAAVETTALIATLGSRAPKLIDASSAHRIAPDWTYGFPELAVDQQRAIAVARRVSNPGCYATGAIALLRPLADAGVIGDYPVTINAVSGFSGGGKAMIAAYEAGTAPAFELYGLELAHKHIAEIVAHARLPRRPVFVPSVGNFRQGMIVSVPLHLDDLVGRPSGTDVENLLVAHYAHATDIKVMTVGEHLPSGRLEAEALNDTDGLEVRVYTNETQRQAVLVARLDNLGKGASGAAVRNLRLMLDL